MTQEKKTEKFQLELVSKIPEFLKDELEEGDMLVKARSLHESFLPEPWFSSLAKDSKYQRTLYRHKDPEHPEHRGIVYGRNLHNDINNGFMDSYYRIFGGPEDSPEAKMQKLIKLQLEAGDPIGISKGFIVQRDKNGEIRRVISLEDSITYKPACKACVTQEVIKMEEDKDIEEQIKKLQEELNDTKMQLEEKQKVLDEKDSLIDETKEEFTSKIEELEEKLKNREAEKLTLEERIVNLTDDFKTFKKSALEAQKKPLIDEIYKYEQDDDLLELYKSWDFEKLEARKQKVVDKYSEAAKVTTVTLEEERQKYKEELEQKDVGMGALRGLSAEDMKLAKQIEEEMKALGDI